MGPQYRSVIFYHNEEQKRLAENYKQKLDAAGLWSQPIVTEISPIKNFYPAEDYHQNYYNDNPNQGYCSYIIRPKVEKLEKIFRDRLKSTVPAR
jgi:peptide-methionine (S)-S-oxide reductase